jgi:hypothetical protein
MGARHWAILQYIYIAVPPIFPGPGDVRDCASATVLQRRSAAACFFIRTLWDPPLNPRGQHRFWACRHGLRGR